MRDLNIAFTSPPTFIMCDRAPVLIHSSVHTSKLLSFLLLYTPLFSWGQFYSCYCYFFKASAGEQSGVRHLIRCITGSTSASKLGRLCLCLGHLLCREASLLRLTHTHAQKEQQHQKTCTDENLKGILQSLFIYAVVCSPFDTGDTAPVQPHTQLHKFVSSRDLQ